jgi:hypothetical protein
MENKTISVGDELVQVQGPCWGKLFVVDEVDGNMLRLHLKNPKPPYTRRPEWSHKDSYKVWRRIKNR